jgi:probable F420-dependent oxidoreductase
VKFGAIYPHQEIGTDPVVIRDWAQAAEALGYSHIVAYDHVLGAAKRDRQPALYGPYDEKDAFHEPLVLFGFLAACTDRIGFSTGILILPQRQTALVAKQVAQIDLLSGGRMRLGVGTGWNYVEYQSLNEEFATRGKRMTEQVDVLRALWQTPVLDYDGEHHHIDGAGLNPLPGREIPVWFGGFTDVAFRRAARMGDGIMLGGAQEDNVAAAKRVREMVTDAGRDVSKFGVEAYVNFQDGPEAWRSQAEEWAGLDADFVSIRATALKGVGPGLESPAEHISSLETFWKAVGDISDR